MPGWEREGLASFWLLVDTWPRCHQWHWLGRHVANKPCCAMPLKGNRGRHTIMTLCDINSKCAYLHSCDLKMGIAGGSSVFLIVMDSFYITNSPTKMARFSVLVLWCFLCTRKNNKVAWVRRTDQYNPDEIKRHSHMCCICSSLCGLLRITYEFEAF